MSVPCRSCGAEVIWLVHARTGKPAPIDVEPVEGGNVRRLGEGQYVIDAAPDLMGEPRYVSHYVTCPDAERWREAAKRMRASDDAGER